MPILPFSIRRMEREAIRDRERRFDNSRDAEDAPAAAGSILS